MGGRLHGRADHPHIYLAQPAHSPNGCGLWIFNEDDDYKNPCLLPKCLVTRAIRMRLVSARWYPRVSRHFQCKACRNRLMDYPTLLIPRLRASPLHIH